MQKCPVCGVRTDGIRRRCPLCGRSLPDAPEGDAAESTGIFPYIPPRKTYDLIFRISTFAAILILLVVHVIHRLYIPHMQIYTILMLGTVCAWIIVNIGARKRKSIAKGILWEAVISMILCLIWDRMTGWHGWSWGYVLPALSALLALNYFIMGIADRRRLSTFTGYFIISLVGTAAVAILYFTGHMTGLYAHFAVISMTVSGILLLSQVVFRGKYFLSELSRWLHL